MAICPECNGLGYKEFEHGLIRLQCKKCKGTKDGNDRQLIGRDDKDTGEPNPGKSRKRKKRATRKADAGFNS